MPTCPDCGGEMKWRPPFYVCQECGLSFRRGEVERMRKKIKDEFRQAIGESDQEKERKERKKKSDYYKWLMKKEDD